MGAEPYTHEQLWALAHRWYDLSDNEMVEEHVRETFAICANELTELLGPLAFAGVSAESEKLKP